MQRHVPRFVQRLLFHFTTTVKNRRIQTILDEVRSPGGVSHMTTVQQSSPQLPMHERGRLQNSC